MSKDKIKFPVRANPFSQREIQGGMRPGGECSCKHKDWECLGYVRKDADRAEFIHRFNGYDVAVKALQMILKNSDNFRPSHCEWPKSTAHNALKQLGELDDREN